MQLKTNIHHLNFIQLKIKFGWFFEYKSKLSIKILPLEGFNRHIIKSNNVLFPDPEEPIIPICSPFLILKLMFFKAKLFWFSSYLWFYHK